MLVYQSSGSMEKCTHLSGSLHMQKPPSNFLFESVCSM